MTGPVLVDSNILLDLPIEDETWRPGEPAFLAGRAFLAYRRAGGTRTGAGRSPLPDVFVGAHAAVAGYRLLTGDAARYRTYVPRLELVAP